VPTIKMDNTGAIALAKNLVLHDRSKHIDVKFHFTRECVGRLQFQGLCGRIGVIEVSSIKPHKVGGVVDRVKCACVRIRQINGACVEPGECPGHTVVIALRMARMRDSVIATRIVCCAGDARVMLSMVSCVLWRTIWVEAYGRVIEKKKKKRKRGGTLVQPQQTLSNLTYSRFSIYICSLRMADCGGCRSVPTTSCRW
jgi:hypothetical protein